MKMDRHRALQQICISSRVESASRDLQRARDAKERKNRDETEHIENISERLQRQEVRVAMHKHEQALKAEAGKAKRVALAEAVSSARTNAYVETLKQGVVKAIRAESVVNKKEELLRRKSQQGHFQVQHALDTVMAHREKAEREAARAAEVIAGKLAAAEARREAHKTKDIDSKVKLVASARQAQEFAREVKRAADAAAMDKAVSKREELMSTISTSAAVFNQHAADVAAAVKAFGLGTDGVAAAVKSAMFQRHVRAEVDRNTAMRAKVGKATKGFHPEVITVQADQTGKQKLPPSHLLRRLTTVPQTLIATAAARHLGACSRREAVITGNQAKSVQRMERFAAAAKRRGLARATILADVAAKEKRAAIVRAVSETSATNLLKKEAALAAMVAANRAAAEEEALALGEAEEERCKAASERRAAVLRKRAKVGVTAIRANANSWRRKEIEKIISKNAALHETRRMQADLCRKAELDMKVMVARELASKRCRPEPVE